MRTYLREWRVAKGKRQIDIANAIGVTKSEISRLEGGQRRMTMDWMSKVASALAIQPEELFQKPPMPRSMFGADFGPEAAPEAVPGIPLSVTDGERYELLAILGDDMSPGFNPGDAVIIDTSRKAPIPPGVFAIEEQGQLAIRRLQTVGGKLRVSFDNPNYEGVEILAADCNVVGRVAFRVHRV